MSLLIMDNAGCFSGVWLDSFQPLVILTLWNVAKYEPAFYNGIKHITISFEI